MSRRDMNNTQIVSHRLILNLPLEVRFRPLRGKYEERPRPTSQEKVRFVRYQPTYTELELTETEEEECDPWAIREAFLCADPSYFPSFIARYGGLYRFGRWDLHHS